MCSPTMWEKIMVFLLVTSLGFVLMCLNLSENVTSWGLRYKADVLGNKTLAYRAEQTSRDEEIVLGRL